MSIFLSCKNAPHEKKPCSLQVGAITGASVLPTSVTQSVREACTPRPESRLPFILVGFNMR